MDINTAASILSVSSNISKEELKKKFKILVMKYHPDRNHAPEATKKFIEIKDAYEYLLDNQTDGVTKPTTIKSNFSHPYPSDNFYDRFEDIIKNARKSGTYGTWNFEFNSMHFKAGSGMRGGDTVTPDDLNGMFDRESSFAKMYRADFKPQHKANIDKPEFD